MKTLRRYPEDFYALPMEFVQVLGRYRGRVLKNAVDVRMAVDAVELMHSMPTIDVYIVVTGDRDFSHETHDASRGLFPRPAFWCGPFAHPGVRSMHVAGLDGFRQVYVCRSDPRTRSWPRRREFGRRAHSGC